MNNLKVIKLKEMLSAFILRKIEMMFNKGNDIFQGENLNQEDFMIVLEKKTKGKREELLKKAKLFFGPGGEGLTVSSEGDCCIIFQGAGGHVTVSLNEEEAGYIKVQIESKEWDYQAKKFLGIL